MSLYVRVVDFTSSRQDSNHEMTGKRHDLSLFLGIYTNRSSGLQTS